MLDLFHVLHTRDGLSATGESYRRMPRMLQSAACCNAYSCGLRHVGWVNGIHYLHEKWCSTPGTQQPLGNSKFLNSWRAYSRAVTETVMPQQLGVPCSDMGPTADCAV